MLRNVSLPARFLLLLLMVVFIRPAPGSVTKREAFGYGVPQSSDVVFSTNCSWQEDVRFKAHCQLKCLQDDQCFAFTYVQGSPQGQCIGYHDVTQLSEPSEVFTSGARTFVLVRTNVDSSSVMYSTASECAYRAVFSPFSNDDFLTVL